MPDLFDKCAAWKEVQVAKLSGHYPHYRVIEETEGTEVVVDGKRLIMACSNNYLGLANDRRVMSVVEESISIKDKNAPQGYREKKLKIRLTARRPVISGVLHNLKTERVLTLRFAPFESMDPCIGLHMILTAKSIEEPRRH